MRRTSNNPVDQTAGIPRRSIMLSVLISFTCIMIASAFVADWFLSAKAQRAETRRAITQATTVPSEPNSQLRIVGVPVTINPSPREK